MARNVIRIIKGTSHSKGLLIPPEEESFVENFFIKIIEFSAMLMTTEKLRNKRCMAHL